MRGRWLVVGVPAPLARVWLLASAVALLGLVAPWLWSAEALLAFVPPCIWKSRFGVDCPSCGMTRAFLLISQGLFAEARALNPWSLWVYGLVTANELLFVGAVAYLGNRLGSRSIRGRGGAAERAV